MNRFIPYAAIASLLLSSAPGICGDAASVRGMYVEQEKNPTVHKNTGLCYYLELKRDGQVRHCTNKTAFRNGDRLRIKVKSNVDGYAYILMLQGSKGDKEVLFPAENLGSNKITAGQWNTLPAGDEGSNAWMKFDNHPGTEVLRMVISRKKVNVDDYKTGDSDVVIASGDDGDKVPDGVQVSINVKNAKVSSTRNLTVESDTKQPEHSGETVVVGKPDKVLTVDFALNHTSGKSDD